MEISEEDVEIISKALDRFSRIVNSLDCACDPAYDYECPLKKDRQLAKEAINRLK